MIDVSHELAESSITLSGPTLFFLLSATIIFLIHIAAHISYRASLLVYAPVAYFIHNDYKSFLSLGPGGTPSTFAGYLKITYLRLYALSDPFVPPPPSEEPSMPATGYFQHTGTSLQQRKGPRPTVDGIAPQRQKDPFPPLEVYLKLRKSWINTAKARPDELETKKSCFEKQGLALFAKEGSRVNDTCRGEIAHVHAIDGSFHMSLHLDDVREILQKAWGQRHPLAGRGPSVMMSRLGNTGVAHKLRRCLRWVGWKGRDGEGRAIVPSGFMLVYAPRNEEELEVVTQIVKAGAWWVMGREIDLECQEDDVAETDMKSLRREAGVEENDRVPGYSMRI